MFETNISNDENAQTIFVRLTTSFVRDGSFLQVHCCEIIVGGWSKLSEKRRSSLQSLSRSARSSINSVICAIGECINNVQLFTIVTKSMLDMRGGFRRAYFRVIVKQPYREDYLVSPATNEVIRVNRLIDQAAILSREFHPFANERSYQYIYIYISEYEREK